jgi:hypothetical protein
LSSRAGPAGKWARFEPMEAVKLPNSEPKVPTGMLLGTVQPRKPIAATVGSMRSQLASNVSLLQEALQEREE